MQNLINLTNKSFSLNGNTFTKIYELVVNLNDTYTLVSIFDRSNILFLNKTLEEISLDNNIYNTKEELLTAFEPFRVNFNGGGTAPGNFIKPTMNITKEVAYVDLGINQTATEEELINAVNQYISTLPIIVTINEQEYHAIYLIEVEKNCQDEIIETATLYPEVYSEEEGLSEIITGVFYGINLCWGKPKPLGVFFNFNSDNLHDVEITLYATESDVINNTPYNVINMSAISGNNFAFINEEPGSNQPAPSHIGFIIGMGKVIYTVNSVNSGIFGAIFGPIFN